MAKVPIYVVAPPACKLSGLEVASQRARAKQSRRDGIASSLRSSE